MSIEAGCNGVEATIVLVAAMLAFPAPWKRKLLGLAVGVVAVQGLNIIRVISLFYLGQWNFDVFEWAHLYVWQALIMLDVLVVWLVWVRTLPPTHRAPRARAAADADGAARSRASCVKVLAWLPLAFAAGISRAPAAALAGRSCCSSSSRACGFPDLVHGGRTERGNRSRSSRC